MEQGIRIGVDIGGTFTDIVAVAPDGKVARRKLPSTPGDYSLAIRDGFADLFADSGIAPDTVAAVVHGTTVATNAILEGHGAETALITTAGFRDVLELCRIRLPELYNLNFERARPLVPRRRRFEVTERIGPRGEVLTRLDLRSVETAIAKVKASGAKALAICLLHAYANPAHERKIMAMARKALGRGVYICASSEVLPEIREYERTSTTTINAYVGPVVRSYVGALERRIGDLGIEAPLLVMQSSGGILGAEAVLEKPAYIVESGPAAGVIGGAALALRSGYPNVITIDMGGTTAKASMVEGGLVTKTSEYEVGAGINLSSQMVKGRGHALKLPVIDVSEIGAGGGSLAAVDRAGLLSVGPESAGAVPGPVCYGKGGTVPTLTDALVVLGYLNPDYLVGGALRIDAAQAKAAVARQIAQPIGMSPEDAARGVFVVAAATMTRAVKAVSTFRGRDPRDFHLFAFGGNGPIMAVEIAEALGVTGVIVPPMPGLFSAVGLLMAGREQEFSRTHFRRTTAVTGTEIARILDELEKKARKALADDGCPPERMEIRRAADLRYAGQAYELTVTVPEGAAPDPAVLADRFGAEHERTYGHRAQDEPVDLVSLRVSAVERRDPLVLDGGAPDRGRPEAERPAYFGPQRGTIATAVIDRGHLSATPRPGPLVIEEYDATTIVPPGWSARLDAHGNMLLTRDA